MAPLVDGEHRLQVIVRDSSGSISEASEAFPFTVLVGGVASAAAITGVLDAKLPGSGNVPHRGVTADENPTLMGTARPGSVVHVYLDGNEFARVTADETGRWWFRSDSALAHGEHRFTAAAENGDGTLGARTGEFLVDIDVVAPLPSTGMSLRDNVGSARGAIADGGRTDDATPVYSGHAEPGALVKVLDGDQVLGQTRVQPDGTWTFRPLAPLADGAHSLSTVVVDEAGNPSPRSEAIGFRVDTSAAHSLPGMIALHQVLGHQGLLQSGQPTSDVTPEIRGRATPDSLVTIFADGVSLGSVQAASDGSWSFSPSHPLADGTHRITASSGTSRHSWAFDLVVDTEPPETATNLRVFGHDLLEPGMITTNTMERFTGNAEAGATITVYDYDRVIGSTTVSEYGMWSFTPTQPFSLGRHSLTAVVTDQAGNSSAHSEPGEFQVRALREGENAAWIDGAEWQGGELHYWDWAYGRVTLKGQSTSDTVTLYTEGQFDGRGWIEQGTYHVDRDADGRFSFDVGFNRLFSRLRQPQSFRLAVAGDPPSLQTFKLISAVFPPSMLGGETFLTDNVGTSRGHIRPDGVTDDAMPIYQGRGENLTPFAKEAALVTIYDGDQVIGHTRVKLDRTWTFRPDAPLADGPHSFSATLSDPAGNTTERSPALDFTVDTRSFGGSGGGDPGGVLAIQSVIDHEGVLVGALQPGQATDERSPEIAGVALANSLVKVRVDGKQVGSVLADADGHWSLILPVALSEGRHNVTASSVGLDGKTVTTAPFSLVIDLTPPGGRPSIRPWTTSVRSSGRPHRVAASTTRHPASPAAPSPARS